MPIYTYRCRVCEHQFEIRQRMADDPLQDCPVCEGRIRRVVNSVGVVFKGKGFYITDSRGGKNATLKTNGKDTAGSDTDAKPTKESDSKADKPAAATSKADKQRAQPAANT